MEAGKCKFNSYGLFNSCYIATILEHSKVLYLDVDSIVLGKLDDLWNKTTPQCGICAPLDYGNKDLKQLLQNQSSGVKPLIGDVKVFNNSVMLLDLDKLRLHKAEEFYRSMFERNNITDMGVQNMYASGEFGVLPFNWCVSGNSACQKKGFKGFGFDEWKIVTWHGYKPWGDHAKNRGLWKRWHK